MFNSVVPRLTTDMAYITEELSLDKPKFQCWIHRFGNLQRLALPSKIFTKYVT